MMTTTENNEKSIQVPMDLALRLSDWHASMGDPVYAVSSSGLAKALVPEERFRAALDNMEASGRHPAHAEHKQEIEEIIAAMKSVLGEPDDFRETIVSAMARSLWACAWAELVERGELPDTDENRIYPGGEITHLAPETHPYALVLARELLEKFEKLNGKTVEAMYAAEKDPPNVYEYGGCIAGACMSHDVDYIAGEYNTPWYESCAMWDLFPDAQLKDE